MRLPEGPYLRKISGGNKNISRLERSYFGSLERLNDTTNDLRFLLSDSENVLNRTKIKMGQPIPTPPLPSHAHGATQSLFIDLQLPQRPPLYTPLLESETEYMEEEGEESEENTLASNRSSTTQQIEPEPPDQMLNNRQSKKSQNRLLEWNRRIVVAMCIILGLFMCFFIFLCVYVAFCSERNVQSPSAV